MTLPKITKQQENILLLIFKFRFLSRLHIQYFLNHTYPKRINDWLNDLSNKHYLHKIYNEKTFRTNSKPAIYYANINAIRYFKLINTGSLSLIRKLYRETQRTESFQRICLFFADIAIDLQKQSTLQTTFIVTTHSEFAYEKSPFYSLKDLSPHLVFVKQQRETKKYFLLEYVNSTLPSSAIRKRLRAYIEFFLSNEWENAIDHPFPVILYACETKQMLISAKRKAKKLLEDEQVEDLSIRFATIADIQSQGVTAEIWEEA